MQAAECFWSVEVLSKSSKFGQGRSSIPGATPPLRRSESCRSPNDENSAIRWTSALRWLSSVRRCLAVPPPASTRRGDAPRRAGGPEPARTPRLRQALELRDGDKGRLLGKGVLKAGGRQRGERRSQGKFQAALVSPPQAVANVNEIIGPKLVGMDVREQKLIDEAKILSGLPSSGRQAGGRRQHPCFLWRSWFSSWTAPRTSGAQLLHQKAASVGREARAGFPSFLRLVQVQAGSWPLLLLAAIRAPPWGGGGTPRGLPSLGTSSVRCQCNPGRVHGGLPCWRSCEPGTQGGTRGLRSPPSPAAGQMPLYQYIAKISGKPTDKFGALRDTWESGVSRPMPKGKRLIPRGLFYGARARVRLRGTELRRSLSLSLSLRMGGSEKRVGDWNRRIAALSQISDVSGAASRWHGALSLVEDMEAGRLLPDLVTFNSAISCCQREAMWRAALRLRLRLGQRLGLEPNVVTFGAVVASLRGQWLRALAVLSEAEELALRLSDQILNTALQAVGRAEEWRKAVDMLSGIRWKREAPGIRLYTSALDACAKAHASAMALSLCATAEAETEPDVILYSCALAACGSLWQEALLLLEDMSRRQVKATCAPLNSAILCCGRAAKWMQALKLLGDFELNGLQPDVITYTSTIQACGDMWEKVLLLLVDASSKAVQLNFVTYSTSLAATAREWRQAACLLQDVLVRFGHPAIDSMAVVSTYNSAFAALSGQSEWEQAVMLRSSLDKVLQHAACLISRLQASSSVEPDLHLSLTGSSTESAVM